MTIRLALFGEHIAQSYSPMFHKHFAKQFGLEIDYQKIPVNEKNFAEKCKAFLKQGGKGANVTMPCKNQAFQLCTATTERAKQAESVNTLRVDGEGFIFGDSTDGVGFIEDLVFYYQQELHNKKILILGAGGAASSILYSILEQKPHSVLVANRTVARAETLAKRYPQITVCDVRNIPPERYDVIINAAADLPLDALRVLFAQKTIVYDLRYTFEAQEFLQWAKQQGAKKTYDGYGMLLEQAAAAFEIWFGKKPFTLALRK